MESGGGMRPSGWGSVGSEPIQDTLKASAPEKVSSASCLWGRYTRAMSGLYYKEDEDQTGPKLLSPEEEKYEKWMFNRYSMVPFNSFG